MGLFRKRETETNPTEKTPKVEPPVSDVLLKALLNNEIITREQALTIPAVSGAVDFISNSIASMPVKLYKHRDGKVEEREEDVRVKLLNGDTGDTLDGFQLKKAMVMDYLLGKGGYCYIQRSRNEVTGLYYVEDTYITIHKNFKPIHKNYVICVEGKEFRPWNFVKLLRNTRDGASGEGLTVEVSKALETAYNTLLYQLALVKSGGSKRGFLKSQRKLGQDEINTLKTAWRNLYGSTTENVVVLNNGLEFQEASNSSVEMQLDQNKNTLRNEINSIFHIYDNDFDRTFKEAIYPIIVAFETALNRDLLLEKEKKSFFFEFDVKEIIRANLKDRYDAYKLAKETGFMTLNEIRRAENMEYIEGMDVINVGLGAVLYDVNRHIYYTPNTDTIASVEDGDSTQETPTEDPTEQETQEELTEDQIQKLLEDKVLDEEFEEDGNSSVRYNENHDETGKFASSDGGGGGNGGSTVSGDRQLVESVSGKHPLGSLSKSDYLNKVGEADGLSSPNGEMKHITLYHGSFSDFDQFDYEKGKQGKSSGADAYGEGFYFTDNPSTARNYGDIIYTVDVAYSTSRRVGKRTGREVDFQYNPETGYWVIPQGKSENLKILGKSVAKDGGRELVSYESYKDASKRFNENHGDDGKFTSGDGGGGGSSGSDGSKEARLKELNEQLANAKGLIAKSKIKTDIEMVESDWKGSREEFVAYRKEKQEQAIQLAKEKQEAEKAKAEAEAKEKALSAKQELENEMKTQPKEKVEQFKIIQATNPMNDDYHVGIRKPSDIKTWEEVVSGDKGDGENFAWGDFSKEDAEKALKSGKITVYSSYPIENGNFVSTSKSQAEQYAGGTGSKIYTKTVPLSDVAWINGDEGQFAKTGGD